MNYTPLFGLPILLAAVHGTLLLALGTTAIVSCIDPGTLNIDVGDFL
jgi:two-component system sensor histidine kinase PilS (NtrC family)